MWAVSHNWAYQPSFVSSNTPWFFNGVRIQWFPTNKLKIEPWIVNGWQSCNKFKRSSRFWWADLIHAERVAELVYNNYGNGTDTLGVPGRSRLHTDDSIEVRYHNKPESTGLSKMAFSFTADAGCEYGGGGQMNNQGRCLTLFFVDHPEQFPLVTATEYRTTSELAVTGAVNPHAIESITG